MKSIVQKKIDYLWAGYIHDFNFNPLMHRLDFTVKTYWKPKKKSFDITISGISFFLFYDENLYSDDEDLHTRESYEWEKTELSIFFYETSSIKKTSKLLTDRYNKGQVYNIDYNLSMELWSTELVIRANKLQINDEVFELEKE